MRHSINTCWQLFLAAAVIAAMLGAIHGAQRFWNVDNEIRERIEAKLASGWKNLRVVVRQARRVTDEGLLVKDIVITDPRAESNSGQLAHFGEMLLTCPVELHNLVRGEPQCSAITIRRATLYATRGADGSWSIAKLWPIPKFSNESPTIRIENATIELTDPTRSPPTKLAIGDVNLLMAPLAPGTANMKLPVRFEARAGCDHLRQLKLAGLWDKATGVLRLEGTCEGLAISPDLIAIAPEEFQSQIADFGSLWATVQANIAVQMTLPTPESIAANAPKQPTQFDVAVAVSSGRLDHKSLPYSLTNVQSRLRLTHTGWEISEGQGQFGPATMSINGRGNGYDRGSQASFDLVAEQVRVNRRLEDSLPPAAKQIWFKFLPEGEVDARAKLVYDGAAWQPDVTIDCRDGSCSYYRFPYRVEQATGTVKYNASGLSVRFQADAGGRPIRIVGDFQNPGNDFTGSITIEGEQIPIDEKLLDALPEQPRRVVRSLRPAGSVNVFARLHRDAAEVTAAGIAPRDAPVRKQVQLSFNRCSLAYEKFSYPVSEIRGTATMNDDDWSFANLVGVNDSAEITCAGSLTPTRQGPELKLHFTGDRVPLAEELRRALPPNIQRLWQSLDPRGVVNLVTDVSFVPSSQRVSVSLVAQPVDDTTSIEPKAFPYRMEKLRGTIRYRDGQAKLEKIEAQHGRTTLAADGEANFQSEGSWSLRLSNFAVDRLRAEHDFLMALPGSLKRAVAQLKPSGPLNLRGAVTFTRPDDPRRPLISQWDVVADLHQMGLDCGIKLDNLFGSVRLNGQSEGEKFTSRGELSLDSLSYQNFQFTEVLGPFSIDNSRVLFGQWSTDPREPKQTGKSARRLTGRLCDGRLAGDAQVVFAATPQYALQAMLSEANLRTVMQEHVGSKHQIDGKLLANLELQGTGRGVHTATGRGDLHLTNADIYELPAMVSMLKLLSVRAPDAVAFTKSDIEFRLQGEHLLFDRLNFNGDAISLVGKGQMGLDKQLDLTFHALVGRDEAQFQVPVLRNVIGEASSQLMQIRVEGTVDEPVMRSEALPGVKQTIESIRAEMQGQRPPPVEQSSVLPRRG